jgi:serine protease Do
VSPAVVSIQVRQRPDAARPGPNFEGLPPGFEEFFRRGPGSAPREAPTSLGSGFIIDQNGIVVTNHHVVAGAEEIIVRTSDGEERQADLVGSDQPTDIAVLRIRGGGRFRFVSFDDARDVRVGDWVVAVGNPFGLDGTATAGIVSAMGRRNFVDSAYVDFIQIDAPINRGNSGGPTFDLRGRVIGVNSAIFSPTGGNVGIGFAIPAEVASRIVGQLVDRGSVTRGWLGVQVQAIDDDIARSLGLQDAQGALVGSVVPDSPAAAAGLQSGDLILTFEGQRLTDSRDLTRRVGDFPVGRNARLEVLRNGERRQVSVRLRARPSDEQLLASAQQPNQGPNVTAPPPPAEAAPAALGLSVRPITPEDRQRFELAADAAGLVVLSVQPNSDLSRKGVRPGDVITRADNRAIATPADLAAAVDAAQRAGRPVLLRLEGRGGARFIAAETGAVSRG